MRGGSLVIVRSCYQCTGMLANLTKVTLSAAVPVLAELSLSAPVCHFLALDLLPRLAIGMCACNLFFKRRGVAAYTFFFSFFL